MNTQERNQKIIAGLLEHPDEYKKVIIYVGTKKHVVSLYEQLLNSPLKAKYESIAWITGDSNSRNQDRPQFIEQEKHVQAIDFGERDGYLARVMTIPSVNTVVMAAPSTSKLYYMQAMGRAIRHDPNDPLKRAFCIEVVDDLPNIRYRIDNRWLFSDVSDALEPKVEDVIYADKVAFDARLAELRERFAIPPSVPLFSDWNPDERYTLLLFKRYLGNGQYGHLPVPLTSANRLQIGNAFNYLSERMAKLVELRYQRRRQENMAACLQRLSLERRDTFSVAYQAMRNQQAILAGSADAEFVKAGYPWITFVSFRFWQDENSIPDDLRAFIEPCANRGELLVSLRGRSYSAGSSVVRFPLPLRGVIGRIMPSDEVATIRAVLDDLREASKIESYEQSEVALQVMSKTVMPLETRLHSALLHIVKENYEWEKAIS